jgi:lysozyme
MNVAIPQAALSLIEAAEGFRTTKYRDVSGLWTIGYGHRMTPAEVKAGLNQITPQMAVLLLQQDATQAMYTVQACSNGRALNDNQLSALLSLCYNIGSGSFRSSTLVKLLRSLPTVSDPQIADQFLVWDKAVVDGKLVEVPGLLDRRQKERSLYIAPVTATGGSAATLADTALKQG